MSRVQIVSVASGTALVSQGGQLSLQANVAVNLYKHGTTTPVTVYADETSGTTLTLPLFTDSNGQLPGWVTSGQRIDFSPVGGTTVVTADALAGDGSLVSATTSGSPAAYSLGQDSGGNLAIGSTLPSLVPGSSIGVGAVGTDNVYVGYHAGHATTTANDNTGIGTLALSSQTGSGAGGNVAVGSAALKALTTGSSNVAVGFTALQSAIDVMDCVAVGRYALQSNVHGLNNTAVGSGALGLGGADVGNDNTAVGMDAGSKVTTGSQNTYVGMHAGANNLIAQNETAVGWHALENSNTGSNTAVGSFAGNGVTTGTQNTFMGLNAGQSIVTSGSNVVVGGNAGRTGTTDVANMTLLGHNTQGSGRYGIAIGESAAITASGAVAIGTDHTGAAASSAVQDQITLGTASHQVKISNNATGAGSAALGANCPAVTATAPYTWFKMTSNDGSTVYVPAWK